MSAIHVRTYRPEDLPALQRLYFETIHKVSRADYTQEQVDAWAPAEPDTARWQEKLSHQEVVVAEVTGGAHLRVRPSPGDTIDGFPGNVAIGAYESRTFISDGETNWITSVLGRGSLGSARVIAITAPLLDT